MESMTGTAGVEPSMTAFVLEDGEYVEAAACRGDEPLTVASPYPVRVVPSELVT
jgi:hypothetical protein